MPCVRLGSGARRAGPPCSPARTWRSLQISRHRDRLAPWYRVALPAHDVVEMLMDKVGFLRHAQENGLPIPGTVIIDDVGPTPSAPPGRLRFPVALKPPLKSALWQAHTSAKAFQVDDAGGLLEVYDRVAPWSDRFIAQEWVDGRRRRPVLVQLPTSGRARARWSTFVARKLRQWPPHTGTSALGRRCRNDEVLQGDAAALRGRRLPRPRLRRDEAGRAHRAAPTSSSPTSAGPPGRSAIAEAGGVELLYTAYCDMVGLPLPAARHQRYVGAKWIDDRRDVQSALYFFRRGELSVGRLVALRPWTQVARRAVAVRSRAVRARRAAGHRGGESGCSGRGRAGPWARRRRSPGRVALRGLPGAVLGIHDPAEASGAGAGTAPLIEERR